MGVQACGRGCGCGGVGRGVCQGIATLAPTRAARPCAPLCCDKACLLRPHLELTITAPSSHHARPCHGSIPPRHFRHAPPVHAILPSHKPHKCQLCCRGLGVLAVLDAQCRFPKSTDMTFVETLKVRGSAGGMGRRFLWLVVVLGGAGRGEAGWCRQQLLQADVHLLPHVAGGAVQQRALQRQCNHACAVPCPSQRFAHCRRCCAGTRLAAPLRARLLGLSLITTRHTLQEVLRRHAPCSTSARTPARSFAHHNATYTAGGAAQARALQHLCVHACSVFRPSQRNTHCRRRCAATPTSAPTRARLLSSQYCTTRGLWPMKAAASWTRTRTRSTKVCPGAKMSVHEPPDTCIKSSGTLCQARALLAREALPAGSRDSCPPFRQLIFPTQL